MSPKGRYAWKAWSLLVLFSSLAQAQVWKIHSYADGLSTASSEGMHVQIAWGGLEVFRSDDGQGRRAILEEITFPVISGIFLDTQTYFPFEEDLKKSIDQFGKWGNGEMGLPPGFRVDAAIEASFDVPLRRRKTHRYFIHLNWKQDDRFRTLTFGLSEKSAMAFLSRLKEESGKAWQMIDLGQALEEKKAQRLMLRLGEDTSVGGLTLGPGIYETVYLPREENAGLLFLFRDHNLTPDSVLICLPVSAAAVEVGQRTSVVTNSKSGSWVGELEEIRLSKLTLRLPSLYRASNLEQ
jgi:hypothetical protein